MARQTAAADDAVAAVVGSGEGYSESTRMSRWSAVSGGAADRSSGCMRGVDVREGLGRWAPLCSAAEVA